MTEKIFDMFVAAEPFLLCILLLVGFAAAAGLVGLMVYALAYTLPGQHAYRNDRICVFQRGVGLAEEGGRVSRVLLKGDEVRFSQTFLARDGSTPVIQIDPSYME